MRPAGSLITSQKVLFSQHYAYTNMYTVLSCWGGKMIFMKKTRLHQGVASVRGEPAARHVQMFGLDECAGMCLCVQLHSR